MSTRDIGNIIGGAVALDPAVITAGAGNDNVAVTGPYTDLTALAQRPRAVALLVAWKAVLAAAATLSLTMKFRDATDTTGTAVADYVGPAHTQQTAKLAVTVVATGPGGGGTVRGVTKIACELQPARACLAATVTADLSAANTDTVAIAGTFVFAGYDELPPS